jgi:hypothetical protein
MTTFFWGIASRVLTASLPVNKGQTSYTRCVRIMTLGGRAGSSKLSYRKLNNSMFKFNKASLTILLALVAASTACGGGYSKPHLGPVNPGGNPGVLNTIDVYAHSSPSIPVTGSVDVQAAGYYGVNQSYQDLTKSATWSTSDAAVATVNRGSVTGVGVGSATIRGAYGGKTDSVIVVVGLAPTITVTPDSSATFQLSQLQRQFFVNATYTDGTQLDLTDFVIWTTSPTGVVKFDDPYGFSPGLATLISTGTTTITAAHRAGEEGSLTVTVEP